jgi:hypothetical protein
MGDGGPRSQHFSEVRTGDALLVANAMKAAPLMPLPLQGVLWCQYVFRARPPVRIMTLGRYLGERISHGEYFRLLDRSHYFLAARIEPPSQRAAVTPPSATA